MNVKKLSDDKYVPARSNPFATEHVSQIPFRFGDGNWSTNLGRLRDLHYRAAIVGPQGSGKTTLLSELLGKLRKQVDVTPHYVFLPEEKDEHSELVDDAIEQASRGKVLLIDGIERVTFRQKFRIFRATSGRSGLVVTSHYPMRLPPFAMTTWIRTTTSELVLDYVLSELNMASPDVRAAGQQSFSKNRGNIRNVLRELYDRHASKRFR